MNVLKAMEDTLALARSHDMDNVSDDDRPSLDYTHLVDMYERAKAGTYSEGKLNRHLGWMQAAVVAGCEGVTLDSMKAINQRHAD